MTLKKIKINQTGDYVIKNLLQVDFFPFVFTMLVIATPMRPKDIETWNFNICHLFS